MTTAQGPASTSATHSSLFILDSVSRQQIAVILIQFRDTREASERQPFLHPPLHHIPSARASRPFAPAARRLWAPALQFEPRRALYFEQTAVFRQSLGRPLTGLIRLLKPRPDTGFSWDEPTHENFPGSSSHDIPRKEKPSTFLKAEFGDLSRNTKSHEYPYNTDLACS